MSLNTKAQTTYNQHIKNYSLEQGLSNSEVLSFYEDDKGFLWIGTQEGLNRFDGVNFLKFVHNPKDENSISRGNIVCIKPDKKNKDLLWLGIDGGGINILNTVTGKVKKINFENHKDATSFTRKQVNHIKDIYFDDKGIAWISTWGCLIKFNTKTGKFVRCISALNHHFVKNTNYVESDSIAFFDVKNVSYQKKGDNYWIATAYGLSRYNVKTGKYRNHFVRENEKEFINNDIYEAHVDAYGYVWLRTFGDHMLLYNPKTEKFHRFRNKEFNSQHCFFEDKKNKILYVGTEKGIYKVKLKSDYGGKEPEFENTNITNKYVIRILIDDKNMMFFSVSHEGFYTYNLEKHLFNLIDDEKVNNKEVRTIIYGQKDNSILVAGDGFGVVEYNIDKNSIHVNQFLDDYFGNERIEHLERESDNLWIGTDNEGLYKYNFKDKTIKKVEVPNSREDLTVNYLSVIGDDLWFSNSNHDLILDSPNIHRIYRYNLGKYNLKTKKFEEQFIKRNIDSTVSKDYSYFIERDSKGNIWKSGTFQGLSVIDLNKKETHKIINSRKMSDIIITDYTWESFLEYGNKYYIGSNNGGLLILNDKKEIIDHLTVFDNGLISNTISGIFNDNGGNIWLITPKGVSCIKEQELGKYIVINYNHLDGIKGQLFHPKASFQDKKGWIYFGGNKGINYFHPDSIRSNHQQQHTIISNFEILNSKFKPKRLISELKEIKLNYDENFFTISFSRLGFYQQEKFQYKYILEGVDNNWITTTNTSVSYSDLPPGTYTFKVKSSNNFGEFNEDEVRVLEIKITSPPLYKNKWTYIILFLILATIVFVYYLKHRREKLIISRKASQFRLQLLRSQMNPHFISNALVSIQGIFLKKEIKNAVNYISDFALLMREMLENSIDDLISLEKEIQFLERYIKIELLRFDHIKYKIDIQGSNDLSKIKIPSMLIQPYVENAITHGLKHLKEDGFLLIEFNISDKFLTCVIQDNGIGRKASRELNKNLPRDNHKSLGLSLTANRLDLLSESINLQIIDLYDENNIPKGTKVILKIPIKKEEEI
ncbi:MAG: histidine kinase [Flavobacteriales bacterium]|nr:histidine kinase [Flavobacteriales bacterium]